ncbi:peptidyl-prolyl cis-trans isomerase [Alicyclobacillus acidocaldarius]|uniref:peptidylprolyl isomerase n=1 Tax=Alicyclobacillus acidocaldarius (strain Tc-4-1) TaxID=1048834 RepID=F8IE05_ALIAT|nr:peptidyl-prolyl cis-trans isomerase [Alicyclobacillus acidocaldarius]AEJ42659.1 PpiC-type peptidyl-prolyl cis-trans isomerase [Alicyclobacillus acidocaldarius subsp. acidocaldarius Tc-4-1]
MELKKERWISGIVGAAAGALIVGGVWFGTYAAHGGGSVVAMVGKTPITRQELAQQSEAYAGSAMLEELIANALIEQAAAREHVTATNAEINQQLTAIEMQNGITSDAQLNALLAQNHMTKAQFLSQIRDNILATKLAEAQVHVTDKQIASYYKQNQSMFTVPETRKIAIIEVKTKADAEKALVEIRSGTPFASVAKSMSTDAATRAKGGVIGTFTMNELKADQPSIASAAFALKAGGVSEPLKVQGGYDIVQCQAITPEHVEPLSAVRSQIIQAIKQQNAESETKLVAQLAKSADIRILDPSYDAVLTAIKNPTST